MKLTAIILAGGKSFRMGEDKGLMLLGGISMVQHVIDGVKSLVDKILIVSNKKEEYKHMGYPVYEDLIRDKGPLAGIYTGLFHSQTKMNIVLSCDIPYVTEELIKYLIEKSGNYDITIPIKGSKTHQLIGVFNRNCLASFKNSINKDELKLTSAFENLNLNIVDANHFDEKLFANINSKHDIKD